MSYDLLMGTRRSVTADPFSTLAQKAASVTAARGLSDASVTKLALSTESYGEEQATTLKNTYNSFETSIKAMASDLGLSVEAYQVAAASLAGMMTADPRSAINAKMRQIGADSTVMSAGVLGGTAERLAIEAYDERDNRNAQMHSVVFNLLSSRQDEFGETLFPTIIASPNEVGVHLAVKMFYVYNDFKRSANGALADYNRKNVMRAYRDMTVLKNELTRVVPVLRTAGDDKNDDKFVPVAIAPAFTDDLGVGVSVQTAWLKTDTKIDLLGISQTNELLASGIMGPTDSLDTYITLDKVLVSVTDGTDTDVFELDVGTIPSATFTYAPTGNYRKMIVALDSDSAVVGTNTTKINGAALDLLDELATHDARVQVNISGSVTLDRGDSIVNKGSLALVTLRNAAGNLVTGSVFDTLAAKLEKAEIIGYKITAFRANSNLRQRGQLVDTQTEYRVIPVPFRSPIGVLSPAARAQAGDETQALQTLVNLTGTRVSNEAVLALKRWESAQENYKAVATASGNLPETNAVGSAYMIPTFIRESANLPLTVDSLKSHERFSDIRANLTEKIRFVANELLRQSEYMAVAAVLTGNSAFKPTVIVATDQVIHNYLSVSGDLRLLGDQFDVRVVSTLAEPIKNKIYVTFGVFDQSRNTTVNPLNSGNMLYTPEMVLNLPISRDGQVSNELTVTPRFAHIVNCPVLGVIDVSGLPTVINKVTMNMKSV